MKILFINLYDDPAQGGGAEVTLHHLTQGLLRSGQEPVFLSTSAEAGLRCDTRAGMRVWRAGLRNVYFPRMGQPRPIIARAAWHALDVYNVAMQPMLRRVVEAEAPDIVSVHNLPGWSCAAWSTLAAMGVPFVQVLHDAYAICPKSTMFREPEANCAAPCFSCRALRLPHRRLSRHAAAVVGVSKYILDRHLNLGYFEGVSPARVIRNARDPVELGVPNGSPVRDPDTPMRFGYIGRLEPAKGIEQLLRAFTKAHLGNAELLIAGTGAAEYREHLARTFPASNVRFLGRVAPAGFYPRIDALVVPSLWEEPLGMVVAEAFAFGKPVIGARRGGIPEMIREGGNGLLVEPSRPEELTAAMELLHGSPGLLGGMQAAAADSAAPILDRDAWVRRYLDLYSEITGR